MMLVEKVQGKELRKYWERLVGEYTFNGLMFCAYLVGVALGVQFGFGVNDQQGFIGVASVIFAILFILMYIAYFVLLILKPDIFG